TKKSSALLVRLDPPSRTGATRSQRVVYHGDLIGFTSVMQDITKWWPGRVRARLPPVLDRWYYVKSSYDWFPRYGGRATDVDLTFHITAPRIAPVTAPSNGGGHPQLDKYFLALHDQFDFPLDRTTRLVSRGSPEHDVGADVADSLAFLTRVSGAALFVRCFAAEIP